MKRNILYIQYTNPAGYPPMEHSSRILADAGWKVLFLGTGAQGADALEFPPHRNIEVKRWKFCPAGWKQKLHYLAFGFWALYWTLRWRPQWIYASDPLSCPIALALSFLPGVRVLYHEHDSPNEPNGESRKQPSEVATQRLHEPGKVEIGKAETLKTEIRKSEGGPVKWQTEDFTAQGKQPGEVVSQPAGIRNRFHRPRKLHGPGEAEVSSSQGVSMSAFQCFTMWSRKKLAQRAGLCVLPNEKRIEFFKEQTGTTRPVVCVWNCPRQEEALMKPKTPDEKFVVFYHGSIVPARLPVTVVAVLAHLPNNVILRIAGYETVGNRGYVTALRAEARQRGVESRLEYLGALSRQDLLVHCREADIGLSFMPMMCDDLNLTAMVGASNKPFDYLACGLALLVSDLPEWKKMFVEPGYGLACDPADPESIAKALRWFVEYPEETRQMGGRGRERILREWNYETQFKPVIERMNGLRSR